MAPGASGRALLSCALPPLLPLLLLLLDGCHGAVVVKVSPVVEVLKGEDVTLPCTFTSTPPSPSDARVEWFMQEQETRKRLVYFQDGQGTSVPDSPLSGRASVGGDFSLTITAVQPSEEARFYCQVTTGQAGMGEASTQLQVYFAPEKPELTRSSSQAVDVNQKSSSEIGRCVTMNGHPQPRIIWFKDDQPLPEVKDREQKIHMVPSVVKEASGLFTIESKLYMKPTKADKDAHFFCLVEYKMPAGQVLQKKSPSIKINLNYPSESATFRLLNTDPVKEGDTVTMKCETDGNPQPEFEFKKDGKFLVGEEGLLTLASVKRSDAGEYMCNGIDFDAMDADLSGKISLTVAYMDPVSVTPPEPQVVMLGDSVEWQCKTKGSDKHTVQWKKGSVVLSQDGSLSIQDITYDKAGEYVCVGAVPSVPGLVREARVNLTVKGKPMIETPSVGEVAKEGDMVTLRCASYGFPAPQFTWKPAGKESVTVEGPLVVSTVTLQATPQILQSGVSCQVSNEHGTDDKTLSVALKRAAPQNNADRVLLSGNPALESADMQQGGSSSVVIAVVVCVLLLLLLVGLLYFLSKKNKLPCGRKDAKQVDSGDVNNDIVVEMKTEKSNEESGLLKKRASSEQ